MLSLIVSLHVLSPHTENRLSTGYLDKLLVVAYTLSMKGWIYIMSNASFSDGRIKIGMSSKDPIERKSELESSGVPEPFVIEYKAMVDDYQKIEQKVHRLLDKYRPNKKREFFTCTIPEAIIAIRSGTTIHFEENSYKNPKEIYDEEQRRELEERNWKEKLKIRSDNPKRRHEINHVNPNAKVSELKDRIVRQLSVLVSPLKFALGILLASLGFIMGLIGVLMLYISYELLFFEKSINGVFSLLIFLCLYIGMAVLLGRAYKLIRTNKSNTTASDP